jgi:CRP-like cAMP-binding protein
MQYLETVLSCLPFLEGLRPDERARVARRISLTELRKGERRAFAATMEEARLVIVTRGRVSLEVDSVAGTLRSELVAGDCSGETALLSEHLRPMRIVAVTDATIGTLDRAGLDAVLDEVPVVALPLAEQLAAEVRAEDDLVRQLLELHAEELPQAELEAAIGAHRRAVARHGARVTRLSPRAIFQSLVVARGREPPFWMLLGFLVALGGARLVVHLILKYGLEKRLFALVPGSDPNPMHVHHFNYGMILIGTAGVAALAPVGRRALRALAFAFGAGAGLVFDEFGLIYNLNPEYAQPSSLISAGIAAALLCQLTWFGSFWAALARRGWRTLRSAR